MSRIESLWQAAALAWSWLAAALPWQTADGASADWGLSIDPDG